MTFRFYLAFADIRLISVEENVDLVLDTMCLVFHFFAATLAACFHPPCPPP
jgi:hypothetical protein